MARRRARRIPEEASAARLYLLLLGAALVIGGIAGFFYEAAFGTGSQVPSDDIVGAFPTNGWDNVFHLVAGVICLASASRFPMRMALGIGVLFTALGVWGLLAADDGYGVLADVLPVDTADNLLHLAVGLLGIVAAAPLGAAAGGGGGGRPPRGRLSARSPGPQVKSRRSSAATPLRPS